MNILSDRRLSDEAARAADLVPWMQQLATRGDAEATFPTAELAAVRQAGILAIPLPNEAPDRVRAHADLLAQTLMQLGRGNLSVGRLVEAHINARHLIARFGTQAQRAQATADVQAGELFALWVTDPPDNGLRMTRRDDRLLLEGGKVFCSGAGFATRVLLTARDESGNSLMLVVTLNAGERVSPLEAPLQGMRAAVTGAVDFSGISVATGCVLGTPGDYLREPDFSAGAWRSSAVASGGLRSLVDLAAETLRAQGRVHDPHQKARLGRAMIAWETSRLWVRQVARLVEDPHADPAMAVAYTGLARTAVESACLDAMRLVQRSLGLGAFRHGTPVERICRDLATYLRQPAPDEVLTEAAAHFAIHRLPYVAGE
jgi:alkylation response protein AidB-like acyl-CoA dehydrogenase